MNPTIEPVEAPLIERLVKLCASLPNSEYKRLRIAVTVEELLEIKAYCKEHYPDRDFFIHAIRGIPLILEEYPQNPLHRIDYDSESTIGRSASALHTEVEGDEQQ